MKIHCLYEKLVNPKLLKNHPKNRNKHGQDQIDRLAELYKYHGVRHPIIVSKLSDYIVAGHGRKLAALRAGFKEMPVVYQDFESIEAEYAFLVSDNAISDWSELDMSGINADIGDLGPDFDINMLGIQDFTLDVAEKDFEGDPDEVPEEVEPVAKLGQIYKLGEHRLMCGDSTDEAMVNRLMDGNVPNIMMTDPPYGVKLDQSWRDKALGSRAMGKGNKNVVQNDDRADWTEVWQLFKGNVAYIWHAGKFTDVVMQSLRNSDFEPTQQIIWNKSVMIMGRSDYHFKHEPCWYAIRNGKKHDWVGDRKQTTIIDAAPPNHIMAGSKEEKTDHPTQKPLACMELIVNHSGDVYEPFGGSGSTLIACEKHNKKCYCMELDPKYVDIIIARWEKFTGKKAELISG